MYILNGQYSFKVGDQTISGGLGTCVFMPRGIPHAWKYVGDGTGRAFIIYTRRGWESVREAVRLQRPLEQLEKDPQLVAQLLDGYGWEIVGPPPF